MTKELYVIPLDRVVDIWGYDGYSQAFVCWDGEKWIEVELDDAVPHDGELLPDVLPKPILDENTALNEGEGPWPGCEECDSRFKCFPGFYVPDLKDSKPVLTSDEQFRSQLETVAASRARIIGLKDSLEHAISGIEVRSIGIDPALKHISIEIEVGNPKEFFNPVNASADTLFSLTGRANPNILAEKLSRTKIGTDAEKRAAENARAAMERFSDPHGEGQFDPGMGTERK